MSSSTLSSSPVIKTEQQEEDLFMSYLNTDYISTDTSDESSLSVDDQLSPEQQPITTLPEPLKTYPGFIHPCAEPFTWLPQMLSTLSSSVAAATPCIPPLTVQHHPQVPPLTPPISTTATSSTTDCNVAAAADTGSAKARKCGRKRQQEKVATRVPPPSQPAIAPAVPKVEPALNTEEEAAKAAMLAKRQERLIKNRAAALLSRKRKREHVTALEEQNAQLKKENDALKTKVHKLTTRVESLQQKHAARHTAKTTTTSVMFMVREKERVD